MAQAQDRGDFELINVWSGPRSLSTSLMYSFAQRDDTEVVDEPFYANYLRVSGAQRPYREQLLASMDSNGDKVHEEVIRGPCKKRYRYCKHMAKQRTPDIPKDILQGMQVLLIRDPAESLPSFDEVIPVSFRELELGQLLAIFIELRELGRQPPVVDATLLQRNPEVSPGTPECQHIVPHERLECSN
eukprot:TRINITY_DN2283_c0_g2_i1.p1 TRINITY_DN2283_c0_g2~~TRINITY_DN2283_c0_g2_i1.p1  ORF type:complete len:187 (+),score=13.68 TRINITY_DN2283_c0_g2_i1:629-1189(+)